jgi:membrane-associated protease RseP (regulator of RpoE activity)
MNRIKTASLFLIALSVSAPIFAGQKTSTKENDKKPPEHQRGWIGGEYRLARKHWSWLGTTDDVVAFPKALTNTQNAGILLTTLSTNTPAYLAGLREADLILEVNGGKITSLWDFRRIIDHTKSGASLSVRAYRNGQLNDYNLTVGCETFREQGAFAIGLPFGLPETNLKFNPSFSLIALGFSCQSTRRIELNSAEQVLRRESFKQYYPSDPCWRAWLGPFVAMHSREIRSQEIVSR